MNKVSIAVVSIAALVTTVAAQPSSSPVLINAIRQVRSEDVRAEFHLSEAGGTIAVLITRSGDASTLKALHAYGTILDQQLRKSDSSALSTLFPNAAEPLARMKTTEGVAMSIKQGSSGFTLVLGASSQASRTAIHDYIRIARGRPSLTREERALNHPANNLGWDTRKAGDLDK